MHAQWKENNISKFRNAEYCQMKYSNTPLFLGKKEKSIYMIKQNCQNEKKLTTWFTIFRCLLFIGPFIGPFGILQIDLLDLDHFSKLLKCNQSVKTISPPQLVFVSFTRISNIQVMSPICWCIRHITFMFLLIKLLTWHSFKCEKISRLSFTGISVAKAENNFYKKIY